MRKLILKKVREFSKKNTKAASFIPGKTYIPYAGRIYDYRELGT